VTIILLLWWSLARGNHLVPSRWQATIAGPTRRGQYSAVWADRLGSNCLTRVLAPT
jgi:hypothetical protein